MAPQVGRREREIIVEHDRHGEEIRIPVGTITGARSGPTFAITSGMHAGEYAGILAAMRLFREIDPAELAGTLIIVPIISTRAFFMRSMQLSPVDEKELHFQVPGNPDGTYSERHIDVLYRIVARADYLVDMHAGELVQSLTPWVPVPVAANPRLGRKALALATGFNVPYLDLRTEVQTIPAFARFLAEQGIANIWTEIGQHGSLDLESVELQYEGCRNALRAVGMLPGQPEVRVRHRYIGQRHHTIIAEQTGIWFPAVRAGEIVCAGQLLGELRDYFGDPLARYTAPFDGIVLYYWSSPSINADRRPHGYPWHASLVRLAGLPTDEPDIELEGEL